MCAGSLVIGHVDQIVGEGGVELPGFVPTKNELLQLVHYWAMEFIDLNFTFFLYDCTGSSEWRNREFAHRRLNAISRVIGREEVTKTFREAEQTFGKGVDQKAWKIFMEGTKEGTSVERSTLMRVGKIIQLRYFMKETPTARSVGDPAVDA